MDERTLKFDDAFRNGPLTRAVSALARLVGYKNSQFGVVRGDIQLPIRDQLGI